MASPAAAILRDLLAADPGDRDLAEVRKLCGELRQCADEALAVEPVLRMIEGNRHRDLGAPGPFVHFLEGVPGYEKSLLESLERMPTQHTVWMLNRMINAAGEDEEHLLLAQMKKIAGSAEDDAVRQRAVEYLKFQEGDG